MQFTKTKNSELQKQFEQHSMPKWFTALDKLAAKATRGKGGFGPSTLYTFGDIAMFDAVNYIAAATRSSAMRPYPNLKEWHDACFARESVHNYLKGRTPADW